MSDPSQPSRTPAQERQAEIRRLDADSHTLWMAVSILNGRGYPSTGVRRAVEALDRQRMGLIEEDRLAARLDAVQVVVEVADPE